MTKGKKNDTMDEVQAEETKTMLLNILLVPWKITTFVRILVQSVKLTFKLE